MSNELLNMIGNVGFPIVVSVYLLVRLEAKLEVLTQSINNLSNVINKSTSA
ncbi:YvrJ family protein [Clostridium sp. OS1-26]|uniref:YvrJ family protein n=1 Tax=Clostridium sp. OS1-26 TaxID=3070681 RepID=UPI0027E01B5D|nr:YvrJ family protein [Clostridium sp. OS1-26]WML36748.1 YvrJ family protein [Clostridium sp. OS1-26]